MGFERSFFFLFFLFLFLFFSFLPPGRVGHTTDMPRTKPSILYCEHVADHSGIVMYARLDLGGRSIHRRATSLVINEKQVYRIIVVYKDEIHIAVYVVFIYILYLMSTRVLAYTTTTAFPVSCHTKPARIHPAVTAVRTIDLT